MNGKEANHCYQKLKTKIESFEFRMTKGQLNRKHGRRNSIPKHNRLNTRLGSNTMLFRLGIIFGRIRTSHVTNIVCVL